MNAVPPGAGALVRSGGVGTVAALAVAVRALTAAGARFLLVDERGTE